MAHHHESHPHHHSVNSRNILVTIIMNILITIAQVTGGIISGSLALLSDALHNFSDVMAAIISYIALALSNTKQTPTRTYGYKRAEILAALFNAVVLIIISFFLFKEAYVRFFSIHVIQTQLMIVVAAIGFIANLFSVFLLKEDAHKSINIRSTYLHMLSDAITSCAVIIGGIVMYMFKIYWIDPALTILISIYVLKESYSIVIDSVNILLDATPSHIDIFKIQNEIEKLPEVKNLHHVHVRNISDRHIAFEGHINLKNDLAVSETCMLKDTIETILHDSFDITHSTIQFEYDMCKGVSLINN